MNPQDVRLYVERWKAVEEIEQRELRAMTPEEHWQKLNALFQFGMAMGWKRDEESELQIFQIWAKVKDRYESGRKP